MPEKFSLKDHLLNNQEVQRIALEIDAVYSNFDMNNFVHDTMQKFPELELKERINWIAQNLKKYLPQDYRKAANVLIDALPPINDPNKTDNDFGDFIYAPYADFVAQYGCTKKDLYFSLRALKEITQRFSAEDAIRYFINAFPQETMDELLKWTEDTHYHVRRLASEGTRPKLPWAHKISIQPEDALPILDKLYFDRTRYVTRSVANHINDISKTNPELVLKTLEKWQKSDKQAPKEMEYIIIHSLRSLIKQGYGPAFEFLGYKKKPNITVDKVALKSKNVKMNTPLEFTLTITAQEEEKLIIDYIIHYQNKNAQMKSKKVFKLKKLTLKKGQTIEIRKSHMMKEKMTTKTLYPGEHLLQIQINGSIVAEKLFVLITVKN